MALRVLLADESVTIKKVFQLALQDFAVDVTTVNVGVDVIQVANKIRPDIIFADVLLQKLNGYDLCREIKSHAELATTPVVLIWSGFMELDEARFKSSGADGHLEKPFDTQHLRQLITSLVPKTKEQKLSSFLSFPKMPEFKEESHGGGAGAAPQASVTSPPPSHSLQSLPPIPNVMPLKPMPTTPAPSSSAASAGETSWSMDNFENMDYPSFPSAPVNLGDQSGDDSHDNSGEDFVAVQLPSEPMRPKSGKQVTPSKIEDENDGQWIQKTLTNFKLSPEKQKEEAPTVKYSVPQEKIDLEDLMPNTWSGQKPGTKSAQPPPTPETKVAKATVRAAPPVQDEESEELFELDLGDTQTKPPAVPMTSDLNMNNKQIEAIVRSQAKEIIEKVVWQVVPEVATRIIERELERLLRERKDL